MTALSVGICGGGIGGLTCALGLIQQGVDVTVFEQASVFARVGADINLTPNAVHVLDGIGLGDILRKTAARPTDRISRTWDTGEETSRLPMSSAAEAKYGAPQLTIHRADLLTALENAIPSERIKLGAKVNVITQKASGATIHFADGTTADFDVVIGADGIHSAVRTALFGPDNPVFTGLVSYRGVFPREKAENIENLDAFTKWWGPTSDYQIVTFPLSGGEEIFVFATTPQESWTEEGWTIPGDVEALRAAYANFHPQARRLLDACESVTVSALHVRDPMPQWSVGCVTLLGDAAHPMVPFMAQGACMAIEDAAVLSRCLALTDTISVPEALKRYEDSRRDRTASVQKGSLANDWMKGQGNADWLYGYHAMDVAV